MDSNNSKVKGPSVRMLWLPNNFSNISNLEKQATVKSESEKCFPLSERPGFTSRLATFEKADMGTTYFSKRKKPFFQNMQ